MVTQQPIVFVVDDDPAVRHSLKWLIESVGYRVLTFASALEFWEEYQPGQAGCLILDVRMPDMSGLELQGKLARHDVQLPIIMITGHADVQAAVRAVKAGVFEFIEKPFDNQVFLELIRKAIELDSLQRRERAELSEQLRKLQLLTPREREVMDLVVTGLGNKQIAVRLGITVKTVEVHRSHVMKKLSVDKAVDLVKLALRIEPSLRKQPFDLATMTSMEPGDELQSCFPATTNKPSHDD